MTTRIKIVLLYMFVGVLGLTLASHRVCPSILQDTNERGVVQLRTYHHPTRVHVPCPSSDGSAGHNHHHGHHGHHGSHESGESSEVPDDNECFKTRNRNFSISACNVICMEGFVRDSRGRCVARSNTDVCMNGGTLMDGYCLCPKNFTGKQCQIALCPQCKFGACMANNSRTTCVCSKGFAGEICDQVVCRHPCENGGECVPRGWRRECSCPLGYYGDRCQYKRKPGHCPPSDVAGSRRCRCDKDCPGREKCCNGRCKPSATETCLLAGRHYLRGQIVNKSNCEKCSCVLPQLNPMEGEGLDCHKIMCPNVICPQGQTWTLPEGQCCATCAVAGELQGASPSFTSCPREVVSISVDPTSNQVNIRDVLSAKLQAHDYLNQQLSITFSKTHLSSCACDQTELDYHHVTIVSSADKYGRKAVCSITVKVTDVHAPTFDTCHSGISAFVDEKIVWIKPSAKDNVGIKESTVHAPYPNNTAFPAGHHIIEYMAMDLHENVATCIIPVRVYKHDENDASMPLELADKEKCAKRRKTKIVAGAIGVGVALLVFLAVLVKCMHKRRMRMAGQAARNQSPSGFTNNVYTIAPPAYSTIDKDKPPMYDDVEPPPVYESIEKDPQELEKGLENPLYMSDISLEQKN